MWRGALVTTLEEVTPGHGVTAAMLRPGLVGGFPWHSPDLEHSHLSNADAWWGELSPALQRAYIHAGALPSWPPAGFVMSTSSMAEGLMR
jgi:putative hydrolase of the HAD superfamily